MYFFINFDNVPGLACDIKHAKNNPKLNKNIGALRTTNSVVLETGLFAKFKFPIQI